MIGAALSVAAPNTPLPVARIDWAATCKKNHNFLQALFSHMLSILRLLLLDL